MADTSPNLNLPYILPAQAQKHVTHNEAIRLLDIIVQLAVASRTLTVPPVAPAVGARYIVAAGAVGVWAGQANTIAVWSATGWVYVAPQAGWQAYVTAEAADVTFDGAVWTAAGLPAQLPLLGLNATASMTNRLTVAAEATLLTHAGAGHQLKLNKALEGNTASLVFQTGFAGRAEMGLAGSDDFSVKVSADGSAFATALVADAATGAVTLPQPLRLGGQAGDPVNPANGVLWLNTTTGEVKVRTVGATLAVGAGGSITDGDKGDIAVSGAGAVWTLDAGVVSLAKMADVGTARFLGRATAGAGVPEALTVAQAKTLLDLTGSNGGDQTISLTGDVTGAGTGSFGATIAGGAVTLVKMADLPAATFVGRVAAGPGVPAALTATEARSILNVQDGAQANVATDLSYAAGTRILGSSTGADATLPLFSATDAGLAPESGGGTANFLRADGLWAAPAGGASDPLNLTVVTPATPPAGTVTLFRRESAGRQMPACVGPVGAAVALQAAFATNKIGLWMPPGSATATVPGVFGISAPTTTGFTATARAFAATTFFTRTRRLGFVTAATAGTVGQFRAPGANVTLGNGTLGGFHLVVTFGTSDAAAVAGARMFMGVKTSFAGTNVEPATLVDCIGVGHGAADTNLKLFFGGSAAQTPVDLGANFPVNTLSLDMYELALFAPAGSTVCYWQVTRKNTGHVASGVLNGTAGTQLPGATTLLCAPWGYRTNNATALAVGLDVASVYLETET